MDLFCFLLKLWIHLVLLDWPDFRVEMKYKSIINSLFPKCEFILFCLIAPQICKNSKLWESDSVLKKCDFEIHNKRLKIMNETNMGRDKHGDNLISRTKYVISIFSKISKTMITGTLKIIHMLSFTVRLIMT